MAWNYKIIVNVISSLVTGYDRFSRCVFNMVLGMNVMNCLKKIQHIAVYALNKGQHFT